jgi:N-acyl-D-amino-acid deacylase
MHDIVIRDGEVVDGTFAGPDELGGIAHVLAKRGKGVIEVVPRIGERDGTARENSTAEMAWMEEVSRACGRPLTFAITQSDRRPGLWAWVMAEVTAARGRAVPTCGRRPPPEAPRSCTGSRAGRRTTACPRGRS